MDQLPKIPGYAGLINTLIIHKGKFIHIIIRKDGSVVTCPSGPLSLQRKAEDLIDFPPDNIIVWTMEKWHLTYT